MSDFAHYFPIVNPTVIFFVVLCIILLAPIIMGKLRIPHIIGMVLAGVAIGKYGFNILERDSSFELFGRVGMFYIMFLAGLELDMEGLKKNMKRCTVFGLMTFLVPFVLTYVMGMWLLCYSQVASLLLACIMSANTLIAYPIVGRYGLQRHESSTLSVGSSMFSLLLSLVVLAAISGSFEGEMTVMFWMLFVVKFVAFCVGSAMFIPRLTRWFLRSYSDAVMQYIFVLAILFFSAALAEIIGLEGIFGAFLSGLIMNRYIPQLSPLMNRLEFSGNALFIPYFLIGVGMLINVRLLFQGSNILWVVACIVVFGTVGKALAAYLSGLLFRLSRSSMDMMFGLTSAHAAGAIAMVLVGMRLEMAPGVYVVSDDMLNGVVVMILFTCIISSIVTERAAKKIILQREAAEPTDMVNYEDDEKILLPVKYPETAEQLVTLGILMRNSKLKRSLVGLNIVYDDEHRKKNLEAGHRLLETLSRHAAAADVKMQTQVRLATNIANGIKHAFKEFNASEIVMGMHIHKEITSKFWGEFIQSLFNGLNRQIIIARCFIPYNTIRRIHVAVPSRAQFEPGFHRWMERLSRMAGNLDCRITFHARKDTLVLIEAFIQARHRQVNAEYVEMEHWNEIKNLAEVVKSDHLLAVITARKGTVSYKTALERLPDELTMYFREANIMLIYPDQYGDKMDYMTFAEPQHQEQRSAYEELVSWAKKRMEMLRM